jgi:DivIVA domain-containing protein
MADDASPSQARATRFDVVLRGYDRAQVDAYIEETATLLEDLRAVAEEVEASALAIGIDDPEGLAKELGRIGDEVGAVLEAARAAAEGLRKRAKSDADAWRKRAEDESAAMIRSATEQSQSMRASAWNEGTSLLNSAIAEAKSILARAQEDSLFMRAEAERDALRLTSDARRDKDEALRSARLEAETIITEARAESDGVLAAAQKQADLAQERARALEDRRSELLSELEATRASISHLEDEIDSRRQELETPEPPPSAEPERTHHGQDVGSVRIVAPSKAVALRPVDPDELVAEVEAIRSNAAAQAAAIAAAAQAAETVAVIAPPVSAPAPPPAPVVEQPPEPDPTVQAPEPPPTVETKAAPAPDAPASDEIGSLFARLKGDTGEQPATEAISNASATPAVAAQVASKPEPEPEPQPEPVPAAREVAQGASVDPVADERAARAAVRNLALKSVKKSLVELQNETLEGLRTDKGWLPPEGFTEVFTEAFGSVTSPDGTAPTQDQARAFAADLEDAVTSAIEAARSGGKGERAVAAAASKVFRTWRSDEAERRLNALA